MLLCAKAGKRKMAGSLSEERKKQRKDGENEHTEASRFKFIMNSFRAPNFNTVFSQLPLLTAVRHL